jgi:hypothetical protein
MTHVTPLMVFQARAEARALLVYAGVYNPDVCFDALIDDAFASGLVDQVGAGVLDAIIQRACKPYAEA